MRVVLPWEGGTIPSSFPLPPHVFSLAQTLHCPLWHSENDIGIRIYHTCHPAPPPRSLSHSSTRTSLRSAIPFCARDFIDDEG